MCFIILDRVSTFSIWCCHITVSEKLIMLTWSFWGREICKSPSLSRQQTLSSVCKTKLKRFDSESCWCSLSLSLPVSSMSCVQCPRSSLESRIWLPEGRRVSRTTSRVTFYSKRWRLVNLINQPHSFNFGKVTFVKNVHIWSADLGESALLVTSPPGGYLSQNRPDFLGNGDIFCHLNDMSRCHRRSQVCLFQGTRPLLIPLSLKTNLLDAWDNMRHRA